MAPSTPVSSPTAASMLCLKGTVYADESMCGTYASARIHHMYGCLGHPHRLPLKYRHDLIL